MLWPNTCVFPLVIASFFIAEQIVLTGVFNPADIFAFTAFFGELKTRAFAMTIFFCTAIVVAFGFQTLLNVLGFEALSIPVIRALATSKDCLAFKSGVALSLVGGLAFNLVSTNF